MQSEALPAGPGGFPRLGDLGEPGVDVSEPGELLVAYLEWYRAAVLRKISALSELQLRTPIKPLGWSPLGLIKHLGWVELRWMRWGFAAEDLLPHPPGGAELEWAIEDGETSESVIADFDEMIGRSRALMAGVDLGRRAAVGGRFPSAEQAPSLGRIMFHLLQEYARHTGQLDVARQLIDGVTGE